MISIKEFQNLELIVAQIKEVKSIPMPTNFMF